MNIDKKIKNMEVKNKLKFHSITMIGVILISGIISTILSFRISFSLKNITEVWYPSLAYVQQLDTLTSDYRMKQYGHLVAATEDSMADFHNEIAEIDNQIETITEEFEKMITMDEERELFEDARKKWLTYKEQSEAVTEASLANQYEYGGLLMIGEIYNTYKDFNSSFDKLIELEQNEVKIETNKLNRILIITFVIIFVVIVCGILVAVTLSRTISNSIIEPLLQITKAAKKLYNGDMSAREEITYESADEFGMLAESLRGAMKNLDDYVKEISSNLVKIAKGDLTKNGDEITDFLGDFASIKESFVYILKRFNSTLTNISEVAGTVDTGAVNISKAGESLAEGTTEEASAIEELSSTVDSVTDMAKDSANKTEEAYKNIKASVENAEEGRLQMQKLIEEMNYITDISKEIGTVITTIEAIAAQTSLLSLNAAIEAARAGEAGKGFSIVADEIKNLATECAQSAVNTKELIMKALKEIESGNEIVDTTSKTIEKIINDMSSFADVANSIKETAENQAASLEEINSNIAQVSNIVQNTAATSEETSTVSEVLSENATNLNNLIRRFKLFEGAQTTSFDN